MEEIDVRSNKEIIMKTTIFMSFLLLSLSGCAQTSEAPKVKCSSKTTASQEPETLALKATGAPSKSYKLTASQESTTAEFLMINATSVWLTLYVDGERSCSSPPGDQCTTLVSVGGHSVKAKAPDGRYVTRSVTVPAVGFTWTITENEQ